MRYLSVCSGIEAATCAWKPLSWQSVGFSEIEKFPSDVLAHHYPDTPNFGDMNDFQEWPESDVDVLVGGTPCTSFSIAGLRAGLDCPNGNLALVYLAIAERYRPSWLVWENVPGVLSSDGGRDFGAIVGGMVKLGYSVCWSVLNAQYFGVAQRRRRVFIVAGLGDWRDPAQILFEHESLLRHPPPSRESRNRTAGTSGGGAEASRRGMIPDVVGALSEGAHTGGGTNGQDAYSGRVIPQVIHGTQDPISSDQAFPLGRNQGQENAVAFAQNQRDEVRLMDKAGALAADPGVKQQSYVFEPRVARNGRGSPDSIAPPLKAQSGTTGKGDAAPCIYGDMAVRRLTPLECERLQGFPDGYTDLPGASDAARYRALGNTMAVPVMKWIGERIENYGAR